MTRSMQYVGIAVGAMAALAPPGLAAPHREARLHPKIRPKEPPPPQRRVYGRSAPAGPGRRAQAKYDRRRARRGQETEAHA